MDTKIILIRHAQSWKNIKDIHGGDGEGLTPTGKKETSHLADKLGEIGINKNNAVIIYPVNMQAKETAEILRMKLNISSFDLPDFKPLYFGLVHGLTNEAVAIRYPHIYELLLKWRNKEIEICDLKIPKMENPIEFYNRGLNILRKLQENKYNIFIATNSLYILLLNILFGNTCIKGGGYKHFNIPNCGMTMFEKSIDGNFAIDFQVTNVPDILEYARYTVQRIGTENNFQEHPK